MRVPLLLANLAALVVVAAACGGVTVTPGTGGAGGTTSSMSATASSSRQASAITVTSSSVGMGGAGGEAPDAGPPDADDGGTCTHCNDFLLATEMPGGDPIAVANAFCPGGGFKSPYARLVSWINCGCSSVPGAPCYAVCGGTPFCTGLFPNLVSWTPPDAACKGCMELTGASGCGDPRTACAKDL